MFHNNEAKQPAPKNKKEPGSIPKPCPKGDQCQYKDTTCFYKFHNPKPSKSVKVEPDKNKPVFVDDDKPSSVISIGSLVNPGIKLVKKDNTDIKKAIKQE